MKSPSGALVWEIWRKNRWGFALLLLLLAACAGWGLIVQRLQQRARNLENRFITAGTLSVSRALPRSPAGRRELLIQFKLNTGVIYEGPFSRRDVLSWHGDESNLRLTLNSTNLFQAPGSPLGDRLSWTVMSGNAEGFVMLTTSGDGDQKPQPVGHEAKGVVLLRPYPDVTGAAEAGSLAEQWRVSGLAWSTACAGFSVLALFVIFGGTEPQEGHGFTGVPPRRFTLPVRTGTVIAWPLGLGSLSVVALVMAWSRLVFPRLLPQPTPIPEQYLSLLLVAGLTLFQAIVWGLPSFPKTRITLLTVLIPALLMLAITRLSDWFEASNSLEAAFAIAWLIGIAAAWLGVRQERQGRWAGWQRRSVVANFLRRLGPRPFRFGTPLQAQIWFKWRRNCRVPLLVWWLAIGLILGAIWKPDRVGVTLMFVSFSFGVFLVISGLNLARDGSSRKLSLSTFTATRPVSTSSLLTAKLLAGGATWFLAVLTVAVTALWVAGAYSLFNPAFVPPGYSRFAAHQLYLPRDLVQGAILGLCLLAVSLHIFIGILPLSLSGKIPGFPWSLLPLLLLVGGISNAWMWFERHNWPMDLLCSLLSAMVTVKLLVAWWAFRRAINLGLVSWTLVAGYSLLWLVATGVFLLIVPSFAYLSGDLPRIGMPTASILAGLLSVPLARIALSPLALNLNRHR